MQVTIKEEGPCRKSLHIEVPSDTVEQRYADALSEYKKHAKIPGFRPGKAPKELVEKRYGKDALKELKERMIPEFYQKAIQQEQLQVATVLNVTEDELLSNRPFSFTVLVDAMPAFELGEYRGLGLKSEAGAVTDENVEDGLKQLLERYATYDEVTDRPIQEHDVAQVSYEAFCDGEAMSGLVPEDAQRLAKAEDTWISCDENEFLPGLGVGLVGASVGDEKDVTIRFPDDFVVKEMGGREAVYRMKIKALRVKNIPPINAELLKKFELESEEQLREQVRGELERHAGQQEQQHRTAEIARQLLAQYTFDLPESEVQEETRELVYDMVRNYTMRGMKDDDITGNKDKIFEMAAKSAEERVRLHYVLDRIADNEKIVASRNEAEINIRRAALSQGLSDEEVKKHVADPGRLRHVMSSIRRQRTLDFLLNEAKIEE